MINEYENLINGMGVRARGGHTFEKKNPADVSDVIGYFPNSSRDDVDDACFAAAKAFREWSHLPPTTRGEFLCDLASRMMVNQHILAETIVREVGKGIDEGAMEVKVAADIARFSAEESLRTQGHVLVSTKPNRMVEARRVPVGVFGVITAWNSPLAIIARDLFPALACGNTVVLKPSEDAPDTARVFGEIVDGVSFPAGVVNIVHGKGSTAGEALVDNLTVNGIAFTGSATVGRKIESRCGQLHKRCSLEMGGKNALIVMDDADLQAAAKSTARGAFSMAGQRCASTSRVLVSDRVHDDFMKLLVEETTRMTNCPVINDRQFWTVLDYIENAKTNTKLVHGGNVLNTGKHSKGYYIENTIFDDVDPRDDVAQDEIFGPVLVVLQFSSLAEAIDLANGTVYGLTASIYTKNMKNAMVAAKGIQSGVVYVNAPTFGAEATWPFGGVKCSGNGTRVPGIEFYTDRKVVCIDCLED